ncbi:Cauli_VI domain-containing protein [Pseudomonas sp. IT-P12]|jgi:hypothetical protein|uniref:hypothetical protein n=1 Tax=Pseudomonas TaxID=286 RepID=UPI001F5DDFA4|nr:hypothetical protein [Pseudomonas fluorescens]
MCTLTHFVPPTCPPSNLHSTLFASPRFPAEAPDLLRFQVVLAGNAFFHIKEISTGHVRGFRSNHNEACALARALELRGRTV